MRHTGCMSNFSPFLVVLSEVERKVLHRRAHAVRSEYRERLRAQIVLAAADQETNAAIAARLHLHVDTVRKWRKRFAVKGMAGLRDEPRPGRPRRIGALERAEITALACTLPAETGLPLSRFSHADLAGEATGRGLIEAISPSTVRRILRQSQGSGVLVSCPIM